MQKKDIIDDLFDKEDNDDLLALNDTVKDELYAEDERLGNLIMDFIDHKVHPESRDELKGLIVKRENVVDKCLLRANQVFYKNGVSSGAVRRYSS